jgi:hypothetical protein
MAGASTLTNFPSAVPVANPLGSAETFSMYAKYSSLFANSGSCVGVSALLPNKRVEAANGKACDENASTPDRAKAVAYDDVDDATISESNALFVTPENMVYYMRLVKSSKWGNMFDAIEANRLDRIEICGFVENSAKKKSVGSLQKDIVYE